MTSLSYDIYTGIVPRMRNARDETNIEMIYDSLSQLSTLIKICKACAIYERRDEVEIYMIYDLPSFYKKFKFKECRENISRTTTKETT